MSACCEESIINVTNTIEPMCGSTVCATAPDGSVVIVVRDADGNVTYQSVDGTPFAGDPNTLI